jgi:hypothetical protein
VLGTGGLKYWRDFEGQKFWKKQRNGIAMEMYFMGLLKGKALARFLIC